MPLSNTKVIPSSGLLLAVLISLPAWLGNAVAQDQLPSESSNIVVSDAGAAANPSLAPEPAVTYPGGPTQNSTYVLHPSDSIDVTVFREDDLATQGMVRMDGQFDMKLIGPIHVAGLSVDQASEAIRQALEKDYLQHAKVSITIIQYARRTVNVLGEVHGPGLFNLPDNNAFYLSDAIAQAGGFTVSADPSRVLVKRIISGKPAVLEVNASPQNKAQSASQFLLYPDDTISVPATGKYYVLGQVHTAGSFDVPQDHPLGINDAITLAGGVLMAEADDNFQISLRRMDNGEEKNLTFTLKNLDNSLIVQPGDTITVSLLPRHRFTVLGQINRPGTYEFQDDKPVYLTDAIAEAGGFTRIANPTKVLVKRTEGGKEIVTEYDVKAMSNTATTQRLQIKDQDTITVTESLF